ncbi:MAG: hypothetical protein QNJ72_09795 [Pleurocapsa sp. MO_226.B13]|nr:hypothetical protein [Pleurocapsa sp. MO_226.B13]
MTALFEDLTKELSIFNRVASSSLQDAIGKASSWDNYLIDGIGNSIHSRWDTWLTNHPTLAWLFHHPLISFIVGSIMMILLIRLLITIYRAIASAIDRMWLWILRSPWLLLKFLFGWEAKPKINSINTTVTNYEVTNNPQQLQEIITRLEQIQHQQAQIMEDLELLKQRSHTIEAKEVNLTLPATEGIGEIRK